MKKLGVSGAQLVGRPAGGLAARPILKHTEPKAAPLSSDTTSTLPIHLPKTAKDAPKLNVVRSTAKPSFAPMVSTHELRLDNNKGDTVRIPVQNYYLDDASNPREEIRPLVELALTRSPNKQAKIDKQLTDLHAAYEMSFRVKDEHGHYNKIFHVPSHGQVIPISDDHYNKLVDSMGPVMRALRDMLCVLYSTPNPSAKDLGIDHLPKEEQDRIFDSVKESVYFEPQMVDPAMKDYPFLAVGGFDAAIGDLDNPEPTFFEYNLGTPSGLSNNIQLLEIIRQQDPELFETFQAQLGKDETFSILREGIESNALAWTTRTPLKRLVDTLESKGAIEPEAARSVREALDSEDKRDLADAAGAIRSAITRAKLPEASKLLQPLERATKHIDGISVVIGPGVHNGAHPDVASIAMFSGMPLVNPSDLYEDEQGSIRLRTESSPSEHPYVTGIYGRAEESFFFMNESDRIPLRSPDYDNDAIGKKLGLELEPGIIYEYIYENPTDIKDLSSTDEIVGVRLDDQGQPKWQAIYESIGRDPSRPDLAPGSFARALKSGALYYSGLGGRTVDDKRVFQAVSRHVAPSYTDHPEAPIARPPRTLDVTEYGEFYNAEDLSKFVVKAPDKSGGAGVMLLVNLSPEKRLEVVEEVKQNPGDYIVQELLGSSVMMAPEAIKDGQLVYGTKVPDWRLFGVMDAKGEVRAGKNAHLVRTANAGSASTNTSQGGGYGVGVVLGAPSERSPNESVLPEIPEQPYVGASRTLDLRQFLFKLDELTKKADPANKETLPRDGSVELLAQFQRQVMDILGRDFSPLMQVARDFEAGAIDQKQLFVELLEFRSRLLEVERFGAKAVGEIVRGIVTYYEASPVPEKIRDYDAQRAKLDTSGMEPKRVRVDQVKVENSDGETELVTMEKYLVGRYEKGPKPFVDRVIAELASEGGALYLVRSKQEGDSEWKVAPAGAYFDVDPEGRPLIGIDLAQDYAMSGLAHERAHLTMWRDVKKTLVAEGMSDKEAGLEALRRVNLPEARAEGERLAVAAEVAMQKQDTGEWNEGKKPRPISPTEPGFISRFTYPDVEGLRDRLHRARHGDEPLDKAAAKETIDRLIRFALESRQSGYAGLLDSAEQLGASSKDSDRLEGAQQRLRAHQFAAQPIFELIFDSKTQNRFLTDDTLETLNQLFDEATPGFDRSPYELDRLESARFNYRQSQQQQQ